MSGASDSSDYYYTRSYQYKKLGTDLHFRYHSMQQGEIRRCRSVKQEQSYRSTWQSSKAAFTVDISKDLQINQITTPADIPSWLPARKGVFDAFDVCWFAKMNLLCLCRQMPPGASWKTAAPGRSSRRLGGCCSCASGTSAITGTSALWHSGSWLLIDCAVQLGRFRRNLWDFDCLRIIGWNMQRTSEDTP